MKGAFSVMIPCFPTEVAWLSSSPPCPHPHAEASLDIAVVPAPFHSGISYKQAGCDLLLGVL